ncbi:peptide-binding protein [Arcobacteraceae bacterium]|nr:peptide-binding protein [Arcobacteraceae bacterium]
MLFISTYSSTLNLSFSSNPSRINPILSSDSASSEIESWIFNGLLTYDKDGKIIVDLATSHKFIDDVTLEIKLKKNVLWHDGVEFTADDVLYTYEAIHNPKIYSPRTSNYKKVLSIVAKDKYTLLIKYKEPYFKALEIWMVDIIPKHIFENEKDLMTSAFNKKPIGTGPYKLKELKLSQDIVLTVNKNYFGKVPKIDKIRYKFVPDPTTSFYMLKQQQLDIGSLTPIQVDRQLDAEFNNSFNIYEKQSFSYGYLGFNLKNKKFENKEIRQAISLAIDRQEIIDILYFGHAKICNGPFLPGTFAYNSNVPIPLLDIEKSKKILKKLGYDKNNPFEFEVITSANNSTRIYLAQIMQYQLEKVDIKMKIRVMEWQAFLNTVVHPRNFESVILGWSLALMPSARSIWHSSSDKKGGFNFAGYSNKKVDALIEKGEVTVNRDDLSKIYKEIYKEISSDLPYLFLYIPNSITAVNKNIKNVSPALVGITHNQEEWIKIKE